MKTDPALIARPINAPMANFAFAALILFLALLGHSTRVEAAAPQKMYAIGTGTGSPYPLTYFTTGLAACEFAGAYAKEHQLTGYNVWKLPISFGSDSDRTCYGIQQGTTSARWAFTTVTLYSSRCLDGSLPDTSKPTAQQCADPEPDCPSSVTDAGITNVTTGWANSSKLSGNIQIKVVADDVPYGGVSFCEPTGNHSCGIQNSGPPTACYQSSVPTADGLYRISCDFPMTYTGSTCTVSDQPGSQNPATPPPAPPCPGASGTVNGVPVCIDSPSSTPNNTQPTPVPGNPNPATKGGGNTSTDVDPVTGTGTGTGGTGAGGSIGGGGDGGGDGGNGNGGTGNGNVSVVVNVPDTMKINEAGTPNGEGTGVTDADIKTLTDGRKAEMGKKQDGLGFSWKLELPQGACTPWVIEWRGVGTSFDWCPHLQKLRSAIGWLYVFLTMLAMYHSVINTIKFNKG